MVSWKVIFYVPLFIGMLIGYQSGLLYYLLLPIGLYGIYKIIARSCIRKYLTILSVLAFTMVLALGVTSYKAYLLLAILMIADVI